MAPFKKLDEIEICCPKGNVFGTGGTFDVSTDADTDANTDADTNADTDVDFVGSGDDMVLVDSSIEKELKFDQKTSVEIFDLFQ